jgi:hypothetical protein
MSEISSAHPKWGVLVHTSSARTEQTEGKKDTIRNQAVNTEGLSLP